MVDREPGVREFKGTAGAELAKRSVDMKEFKMRRCKIVKGLRSEEQCFEYLTANQCSCWRTTEIWCKEGVVEMIQAAEFWTS